MRIPQIQGLRALAAVLVVAFHAKFLNGGFIGVDIFYVISGYLITGLIIGEMDKTGQLKLLDFYQRRIKRLLPSSLFVLLVTGAFSWFFLPTTTRSTLGRDFFAAGTYVSNYLFAWWQNDYQNLNATPSPFIHYWSLAVEEQFYLLWPVFIVLLGRKSKAVLRNSIVVVTSLSLLISIEMTQISPIWSFYSLPTRAWELGIGALVIFFPIKSELKSMFTLLGFAGIIYASYFYNQNTAFPGYSAVLPVMATAFLLGSVTAWPKFFNQIFNSRIAQWLGGISYPLYLWHWPVLVLPSTIMGRPLHLYEKFSCIVLTIILADLTHRWIEEPLRCRHVSRRPVFSMAITATAFVAMSSIFISSTSASTIAVHGATSVNFDLKQVLQTPQIYADGCHVNFASVKSGTCRYGLTTSSKTIVLYGDSHAAQWFPALQDIAKKEGFALVSLTKSSCPAVAVVRADQGGFKMNYCAKWRASVVTRIQALHPYAIIVSNYQYYVSPKGAGDTKRWWSAGQTLLFQQLNNSTDHLIYLSDTPRPRQDIPTCLTTKKLEQCANTRISPVLVGNEFTVVDPTPWLCATTCPAIVDGVVAYRDSSHISVGMSLQLAPLLDSALKAKGLFA